MPAGYAYVYFFNVKITRRISRKLVGIAEKLVKGLDLQVILAYAVYGLYLTQTPRESAWRNQPEL